jgi:hypothetical protein
MSSLTPPDPPNESPKAPPGTTKSLARIPGGIALLLACAALMVGFFIFRAFRNNGLTPRSDSAGRAFISEPRDSRPPAAGVLLVGRGGSAGIDRARSAVPTCVSKRTGDVQLGKTLLLRFLKRTEFPERHQSTRRFPSFREMVANGVTTESRE